jgi:hypothetical protein
VSILGRHEAIEQVTVFLNDVSTLFK